MPEKEIKTKAKVKKTPSLFWQTHTSWVLLRPPHHFYSPAALFGRGAA
jgi:hypothetical protein